ncbi:MAG: hypothetical protein K6L73_13165 [Cellvibrionaceae bacterium]
MGIFDWTRNIFGSLDSIDNPLSESTTNPANGLPMMGGMDIEGNPYGSDLNDHSGLHSDLFDSNCGISDSFTDNSCGIGNGFDSGGMGDW